MNITLIIAIDQNGCIGKDGKLPWKLSNDLLHFKETTINCPVIMGKNTYLSLPKLLTDREHIVLSSTLNGNENISVFDNIQSIIDYLKENNFENAYLIGGADIIKQFNELKLIDNYIITHVNTKIENGDTFIDIDKDLELFKFDMYDELVYSMDDKNEYDFKIRFYKKIIKRFY